MKLLHINLKIKSNLKVITCLKELLKNCVIFKKKQKDMTFIGIKNFDNLKIRCK